MIEPHRIGGRLGNRMFELAYIRAQFLRGAVPDAWVQYHELFDEFRDDIKTLFGGGIAVRPEVSIHVRRTDYVGDVNFTQLWSTEYYAKACALFPGASFLVFTDDPRWCRSRWANDSKVRVVEGQSDIADMNMMAGCAHNIIANSSFSWWAAYLNPNAGRRVIYPTPWHADGVKRITFPRDWEALCV